MKVAKPLRSRARKQAPAPVTRLQRLESSHGLKIQRAQARKYITQTPSSEHAKSCG
ncbi:hypothetical protein CCP4SC76_6280012 [Gammaproteobacteria bacterium]